MKFKSVEISESDERVLEIVYEDGMPDRVKYPSRAKAMHAKRAMDYLMTLERVPKLREFIGYPWRKWHRSFEIAADSSPQYDKATDRALPVMGDVQMDLITREVLLEFAGHLREQGVWETTVVNTLRILSAIIGVARDWRYIDENPMDGISICVIGRRPKNPPKPRFTREEACDERTDDISGDDDVDYWVPATELQPPDDGHPQPPEPHLPDLQPADDGGPAGRRGRAGHQLAASGGRLDLSG